MSSVGREEVLLRKYSLLKEEAWRYIEHYKKHTRHVQAIIAAVGVLAAYVYRTQSPVSLTPNNWALWLLTPIFLVCMANYFLLDMADAVYHLVLLGQRMRTIESKLNRWLGETLLVWDGLPRDLWTVS